MLRVTFLLMFVSIIGYSQPGILIGNFSTSPAVFNQAQLDAASIFRLDQSTAGVTLVFPSPSNPALSKNLQVSNIGLVDIVLVPGGLLPGKKVVVTGGVTTVMYSTILMNWRNDGWGVTAAPVTNVAQSANTGLFGPISGGIAAPGFRALVTSDIPPLPYATPSDLTTGLATKEPTITAGTTGQYYRGDKQWVTFPTIPAAQVSPDWNSVVSPTQILNKPVIPTNTNQLTNGAGFLTAEVDGSVTNEIELPAQASQSGKFLQTNGTTPSWQTALTAEVDGSVTNEIEIPVQTGQANKFLQTNGTVTSWQNTTTNVSAPSTGNTFTSGVAFQPSATTSSFVSAQGTLSGLVGVTGTLVIAVSPTQAGTYTNISTTRYLISVSLVTSDMDTGSLPVPAGWWVRITLTGNVTATYTKWTL